jgi:hypothetical protein
VSKDDTPISDQIKRAVDDLELEAKVREAAVAAEDAVLRGLEATGFYLREHRGDIEGFFDRAFGAIDRRPVDGTPTRSSRCGASSSRASRAWPTASGDRP